MEKKKSENIELKTFSAINKNTHIEEYQEINDNVDELLMIENKAQNKNAKIPNEYDFFTKTNVKTGLRKGVKKKRPHKSKSSLMDIVNAEIEASIVPVTESIMIKIDNVGIRNTHLMKAESFSIFKTSSKYYRSQKSNNTTSTLSPIFPKVLENAIDRGEEIPVEYVKPVSFEYIIEENAHSVKKDITKFLDIELKNIKFLHHHEYSLEKVLADKLVEYFNRYEQIKKDLEDLTREIKVNRATKENLQKNLFKVNNKKSDLRFDQTVKQYTGKLLHSKEKQKEMFKNEKDIKHKIMSLWSDIEMLREKAEVTLTPYVVQITTTVLDDAQFEQEWNEKFDSEYADMLYKLEFEYVNKYLEYKTAKNEQKLHGVEKKKLLKPKLEIDEDIIRKDVENIVRNIIKKEQINMTLMKTEHIGIQSLVEKVYEYYFEIYVDDVFVCESEHYSNASDEFYVEFQEVFSVQIVSKNEKLSIILFENNERVSNMDVKLSNITDSSFNAKPVTVNFVFDKNIKANSKRIGCGHDIKEIAAANKIRLKSSNIFKDNLYTNCDVQLKMGWQQTTETHREIIKNSLKFGTYLKRCINGTERPNVEKLKTIISNIYDRDVSNDENLTKSLNKIIKNTIRDDNSVSLDEDGPEFVRFKLLHLRNIGGFNSINNKTVPLLSSQITTEQLNCLQREKEKNFDMNYLSDKQVEMDPIEMQRFVGVKYVLKLNKNIQRNLNEHLMRKTYKDVVKDFSDFGLRNLFSKPNMQTTAAFSSNSKNQLLKEALNKEQEIQINVLRAFNLLDRSQADEEEDFDKIAGKDGFKVRPLRPFVRVSYNGVSSQTCPAVGCHPTWNHTLKINSKLEPLSSLNINIYDEAKVIISDAYSDDEDQQSRTVIYRYYNKWLGTVQIPLYTVLSLGSLKGIFKISTPPTIFGYETTQNKDTNSLIPEINQLMKKVFSYLALNITTNLSNLGGLHNYNVPLEDDFIIRHLNNYTRKYINDFPNRSIVLTYIDSNGRNKCLTQFLQSIPMPSREFFPKNPKSCESAVSKSSGFSRSSSSKSSRGKKEISNEIEDSPNHDWASGAVPKTIDACLRYVALIPTYEVNDTHVVALTGIELLRVLHGSAQDHTILLASYFLHSGIKCWIATGIGLPRGLTTYVLIQYDLTLHRFVQTTDKLFKSKGFLNKNDGYAWYVCDAVSGERYELRDVGCPLKTVHFVFDDENIWMNIQSSQDIENMSFDLSRSSDWETVFDETIFIMRNPAMLDSELYSAPPNVEALRSLLESKIKTKVQKWRSHLKTIWNRYCSGVLRDTLPHWEYWAFNQSEPKPGPSQKLKQLMVTYKIFGFPLNMPFVNTKSVISSVKATSLHVNDDPSVEFALGVERCQALDVSPLVGRGLILRCVFMHFDRNLNHIFANYEYIFTCRALKLFKAPSVGV